jgi:serine/threonine-protein kinase
VDHPNVVEVYDVGQEGPSFYMVMELLEGEPLAQRMAAQGTLSASEICRILIPITRGLAAAHEAGVIHRDLKPDNIFLCRTLEGGELPKVLDFGVSKMSVLNAELGTGITRQGMVVGTPHYMSPEQIRGGPIDARTDIYALGVILYQALSGELPFPGDNFADLVLRIMEGAPKPLAVLAPHTPPGLTQLVEQAMARDPAARPGSARELGVLLEPFGAGMRFDTSRPRASQVPALGSLSTTPTPLATESLVASSTPPLGASGARPTRRLWLLAGGVGLLGVAAAGLLIRLPEPPATEPPRPTPIAPGPSPSRAQEEELPVPETSISPSLEAPPAPQPPAAVEVQSPPHVEARRPGQRPSRPPPPPAAPKASPTGRTVSLSADDFK